MNISPFWLDLAAGMPLGPWWLITSPEIRLKAFDGGEELTPEEYATLPAAVRRVLERQYERAA